MVRLIYKRYELNGTTLLLDYFCEAVAELLALCCVTFVANFFSNASAAGSDDAGF